MSEAGPVAAAPDHGEFAVRLMLRQGYQFSTDFGLEDVPPLVLDEPTPLGEGHGPNAARVLAAAIGNCLSASLLFCLRRARLDVAELRTTVEGSMVRNPRGRLRLGPMRVKIEPVLSSDDHDRMGRCLELFEDFCVVTQSVRDGIDVTVEVGTTEPNGVTP